MLDGEILAHAIGAVKHYNVITAQVLCRDLKIEEEKAESILKQLEELSFVDDFGGYYARIDLVGMN